jgi:hypothetical protein
MTMSDERRQFRILFRHFLAGIIDLESLSASGDLHQLLARALAVLAAFGFVVTIVVAPRLAFSTLPPDAIVRGLAAQADFMIAATTAVVGAVVLLAWNLVLPDRRDSSIIGLLPVRARTILLAKAAALVSAAGLSVLATNIAMGLASRSCAPAGSSPPVVSRRRRSQLSPSAIDAFRHSRAPCSSAASSSSGLCVSSSPRSKRLRGCLPRGFSNCTDNSAPDIRLSPDAPSQALPSSRRWRC